MSGFNLDGLPPSPGVDSLASSEPSCSYSSSSAWTSPTSLNSAKRRLDDDVSSSDVSSIATSTSRSNCSGKKKRPASRGICLICGDQASGVHYGARSCKGCKSYFRRSVQSKSAYKCYKNGNCKVTKTQRIRCQGCRFQRCLEAGMTKNAIRGEAPKKTKPQVDETPVRDLLPKVPQEMACLVDEITYAHESTITIPFNNRLDGTDEKKARPFIDFNELSSPALLQVMKFVQKLPGYHTLSAADQQTLLSSNCMEMMLIRMCDHYDQHSDRFVLRRGVYLTRLRCLDLGLGDVEERLFLFARTVAQMRLDATCQGILCALCFYRTDILWLQDELLVESIQEPLVELLRILLPPLQPVRTQNFSELLQSLSGLSVVAKRCKEMIRSGQQQAPDDLKRILCPTVDPMVFSLPLYHPVSTAVVQDVQSLNHTNPQDYESASGYSFYGSMAPCRLPKPNG